MSARRILLGDGHWHTVAVLTWPAFRGQPGYAALLSSENRWLVGPASALLAVEEEDDDSLDALLARLRTTGLLANNTEFVGMLAGLVEDVVVYRCKAEGETT